MTAQMHERLVFEGEQMSMMSCPPLPEGHPRILTFEPDLQAPLDRETSAIMFSTGCWRRYQGSWEIKEGRFYLIGLRGRFQLQGDEPLLADWFSGFICIPQGVILKYVHMGFDTLYEREIHVEIQQGQIVASRVIDNRGRRPDIGWEPPIPPPLPRQPQ